MTRKASKTTAIEPARDDIVAITPPPEQAASPGSAAPKGKLGAVTALLRRPDGAGIEELTAATGWQAHTVRGAIAGALKRKHGLTIRSEKTAAGRVYRIPGGAA